MSKGDIEYLCLLLLLVIGSCLFFGLLYVGIYAIIKIFDFILRGHIMDKKKNKKNKRKNVVIVVNGSIVKEPKCNDCNYCECETCPTWHGETLEDVNE